MTIRICNRCNIAKELNKDNFPFLESENRFKSFCKECANKRSNIKKINKKYGIIIDEEKMFETFTPVEWWKFTYYGTPNGKKMVRLPYEIYENEENLLQIIKYVLINEIKLIKRDDFLKLNIDTFKQFNIYFNCLNLMRDGVYYLLNKIFPNYNFRAFEFNTVPRGYWKNKLNCDEYMKYIIEEKIGIEQFSNVKREIPKLFTQKSLLDSGYGVLRHILNIYKYYSSFYEWLNYLYPEWNLTKEDFKEYYGFDGTKLNSNEEIIVYDILKHDLKLNVIATGLNRKFKFYNNETDEKYIPDFLIKYKDKQLIVEYFGLYHDDYSAKGKVIEDYYFKTLRKIEYFNNILDYGFISIFPYELKDKEKLKQKIMKGVNNIA